MTTPFASSQGLQLAQQVRGQFLLELQGDLAQLADQLLSRFTAWLEQTGTQREQQERRDAWQSFQQNRQNWTQQTLNGWRECLDFPGGRPSDRPPETVLGESLDLSLVTNEVVENRILSSRLVLGVLDKVAEPFDELQVRIQSLEGREELDVRDVLRPEVLIELLIESWTTSGMTREAWQLVSSVAQRFLVLHLQQAYERANLTLIQQGVLATIDLRTRVRRSQTARRLTEFAAPGLTNFDAAQGGAPAAGNVPSAWGALAAQDGGAAATMPPTLPMTAYVEPAAPESMPTLELELAFPGEPMEQTLDQMRQSMQQPVAPVQQVQEETRLMTRTVSLADAQDRTQGMFGQLKRLMGTQGVDGFGMQAVRAPSAALAAALAPQAAQTASPATVYEDYTSAGIVRTAERLRATTNDLKQKAETKGEKAVIELVALMFQAILAEDRIPPAIRLWFARLQMPVLRVALADAEFFGTVQHPARQLIDRMGSCVMGFDAANITGSALEGEIKRIVQVIEQYPDTGKRVFQIVYDEFQKFLAKYLAGKDQTQKVVSVAQQVEQKETLVIQYTIEFRNMLAEMPVRDEIRDFLFKVWAEAMAVSAVRQGAKDAQTQDLRKAAADLVWAVSAKPSRGERAQVIQNLPQLLQRLRTGMNLLNLPQPDQESHIKAISNILADAFMSKTQAIPQPQIDAMTQRLANLDEMVGSEEGAGDIPLNAEHIEMLLGIDASSLRVVTEGGSHPSPAMEAWAKELQVGSWFTLDYQQQMAKVQFVWRSDRKNLHLFTAADGTGYLMQAGRLASYLQAGLLLPQEEEALTVRATRAALNRLEKNPATLLR